MIAKIGGLLLMTGVVAGCASTSGSIPGPAAFPGAARPVWTEPRSAQTDELLRRVLETALTLRGTPYRLGGSDPDTGFDCSGLVHFVYGQHQVPLPRTVAEQYGVGHEVAGSRAGIGDLVFFSTTGPGATHVGIVVDPVEGTFLHAPGTGAVVRIERMTTPYWRARLLQTRRVEMGASSGN